MKNNIYTLFQYFIVVCILLFLLFKVSMAGDFEDSEVKHIGYPEWFTNNPFYELDYELKNARTSGKLGLMILFTTQGCSYCDVFINKSLGDPEIALIVKNNFTSIGMEIFNDENIISPRGVKMSMKKLAKIEKAEFSPTLVFYGEKGKRLLRVSGYQSPDRFKKILGYMISKHYRIETLSSHLKHRDVKDIFAKPVLNLKEDPLFDKSPYMLHRSHISAGQPLLVLFEKPECSECEDFHRSVLELKEVRGVLDKFEVVRFDAEDNKTPVITPNGKRVTPAYWFNKTRFSRLPALMLFDESGNKVLETDALVLRQRMLNSLNYVIEKAYAKNWTYQRFARSKGLERNRNKLSKM